MNQKRFVNIAAIIILLVVVAGGVVYYYVNKQKTPASTPVGQQQTEDKTVDWKIYRNEEYRFEFKYPSGWTLDAPEREHDFYLFPLLATFKLKNSPIAEVSLRINEFGGEVTKTLLAGGKEIIVKRFYDNPCGGSAANIPLKSGFLVLTINECTGRCDHEADPEGLEPFDCKYIKADVLLLNLLSTFKFIK